MTRRPPQTAFRIDTTGTETAVRSALSDTRGKLALLGLDEDALGTVELVLAEALNNICEHAYAGLSPGPLRIDAALETPILSVILRDRGHPLPGNALPEGRLPDPTGPRDTLPEGGFGWFLIRDLTESVSYRREGDENRLELRFLLHETT